MPFTITRLNLPSGILAMEITSKDTSGCGKRKCYGKSERLTPRKLYPTCESSNVENVALLFLDFLSLPLSGCESPLQAQLARSDPRRRKNENKPERMRVSSQFLS